MFKWLAPDRYTVGVANGVYQYVEIVTNHCNMTHNNRRESIASPRDLLLAQKAQCCT